MACLHIKSNWADVRSFGTLYFLPAVRYAIAAACSGVRPDFTSSAMFCEMTSLLEPCFNGISGMDGDLLGARILDLQNCVG